MRLIRTMVKQVAVAAMLIVSQRIAASIVNRLTRPRRRHDDRRDVVTRSSGDVRGGA